jgi:hypothetical protein
MGISTGQVVGSALASTLCQIPPGPCQVAISNGGTGVAYVGVVNGTFAVSATNGIPIPSGGTFNFTGFPGSAGGKMQVIVPAGVSTVGVLLSTAAGLAQPGVD